MFGSRDFNFSVESGKHSPSFTRNLMYVLDVKVSGEAVTNCSNISDTRDGDHALDFNLADHDAELLRPVDSSAPQASPTEYVCAR